MDHVYKSGDKDLEGDSHLLSPYVPPQSVTLENSVKPPGPTEQNLNHCHGALKESIREIEGFSPKCVTD